MMTKTLLISVLLLLGGCGSVSTTGEKVVAESDQNNSDHARMTTPQESMPKLVTAGERQQVLSGKPVYLYASRLDRSLDFSGYLWKEGEQVLAEGKEVVLDQLAPGTHEIILEAVGRDGRIYTDSVTVEVKANLTVDTIPQASALHFVTPEDTPFQGRLRGSDVDGDPLRYLLVALPQHGTLSGSAAHLTYTPDPDFYGVDRFVFKTNDGKIDSDPKTVTVDVEARNDAPVVKDIAVETSEDSSIEIQPKAGDIEGDRLSYRLVAQPENGQVTIVDRHFVYTPNKGFAGKETFQYLANDGKLDSNIATVTVDVVHVNHLPNAIDKTFEIMEDATLRQQFATTDSDGDPLTYRIVQPANMGEASFDTSGVLTYHPEPDRSGTDTIQYVINDTHADTAPATITINILAQNDAPVAQNLQKETDEDKEVSFTLEVSDVDNTAFTYTIVQQPQNGSLSLNGAQVRYTPNPGFSGSDMFLYKANDGASDSNVATVEIVVREINHVPQGYDQSVSVVEDSEKEITLAGSDSDGDALTYHYTQPAHGSLSGSAPSLLYRPQAGYVGSDSFTYRINDGSVDSAQYTISIEVTQKPNNRPEAEDLNISLSEDQNRTFDLQATDADQQTLTYRIVSEPDHGTLVQNGSSITYQPQANYYGSDHFSYVANDGNEDSAKATVTLEIAAVNDKPVAFDAPYTLYEDNNLSITLQGSDVEDSTLFYSVSAPQHGAVACSGAACTYTPQADYNGQDSFTFTVTDAAGAISDAATISLTIVPQNDAPVANDDSIETREDQNATITLRATDPDSSTLTYQIETEPQHGTVTVTGDQALYQPEANYNGTDSFSFIVKDDENLTSNSARVDINVISVNDAPTADPQSVPVDEDSQVSITLRGSDTDGDTLTYEIVDQPSFGALSGTPPNLIYTPNENYNGTDRFSFIVFDGNASSAEANVTITVNPINDVPVAAVVDDNITAAFGESVLLDASPSRDVEDGASLSYAWFEGSVSLGTGVTLSKSDFSLGLHTITLHVTDSGGLSAQKSVTVNITDPVVPTTFVKHTLLSKMNKPKRVYCVDIDGDGYDDILTADAGSGDNRWLHNERNQSFDTTKPPIIDNNQWTESIHAGDIDGDGDIDIVPGSYGSGNIPTLAWYENDGSGDFSNHSHEVTVTAEDAAYVYVVDLDDDGHQDIVTGVWDDAGKDGAVVWYENDGNQNFQEHFITQGRDHIAAGYPVDLDKDGDKDLVVAAYGKGAVVWFENDGSQNFQEHTIGTSVPNVYDVTVADLNKDGYLDVIGAPDGNGMLLWFENMQDGHFTTHTLSIGTTTNEYGDVEAGDIDNDGDTDILYSAYSQGEIGWFENVNNGESFVKHTIASGLSKPSGLSFSDLDYDGDLDFAVALFGEKEFAWYENQLQSGPGYRMLPKTGDSTDGGYGSNRAFVRDSQTQIVSDTVSGLQWLDDESANATAESWSSSFERCEGVSAGDYDDWRIPYLHELYYLVDRSKTDVKINTIFQNMASDNGYWVSEHTDGLMSGEYGWVDFSTGTMAIKGIWTTPQKHVRCVRGKKFEVKLIRDDTAKVVLDYQHNLMWDDDTSATIETNSWDDAITYCENLTTGGYSDWRMPNINELYSIAKISGIDIAFYPQFQNSVAASYWSSTQMDTDSIYTLNFGGTYDDEGIDKTTSGVYVRCVRNIR